MTTDIENTGKVFLELQEIESKTYQQIVHMVGHHTIERVRVIPDCYKNKLN